jgi:hypothetical protein
VRRRIVARRASAGFAGATAAPVAGAQAAKDATAAADCVGYAWSLRVVPSRLRAHRGNRRTTDAESAEDKTREEAFGTLEVLDPRQVGEQASAVGGATDRAIRLYEKAKRAAVLGLGTEVATLYREAAERDRLQAIRQLRWVIAQFDERLGRDDWQAVVDRTNRGLNVLEVRAVNRAHGGTPHTNPAGIIFRVDIAW